MGYITKLKPEVVKYIISKKHKLPEASCRRLAQDASTKFDIKLSKSAVNKLLKEEWVSSPVGRRSKQVFDLEKELGHGGFFILHAVDSLLQISNMAARILNDLMPTTSKIQLKDIEIVVQNLMIFKSLYDVTFDISMLYNKNEIWSFLGRRPTRATFNRIVNMIQDSQLFTEQVVSELSEQLKPASGFRFVLSDQSSFFVDAKQKSIWQGPVVNMSFIATHYSVNSYISKFLDSEVAFSIFNTQGSNLLTPEVLNLISSFNTNDRTKRIIHVELLDLKSKVIEKRFLYGSPTMFFMLGFWPWQLDIMYGLERNPAKNKITAWRRLGTEYFYQIEEVPLPQHLVTQRVSLRAIILKKSSLSVASMGILTNIPRDILPNYLNINQLHYWFSPEEKYKIFNNEIKKPPKRNLFYDFLDDLNSEKSSDKTLDKIFEILSSLTFRYFQYEFLPEECQGWNLLKIKDVFLRQKATLQREKDVIFHNSLIANKLCKEEYARYICQRLNSSGINDEKKRLIWFK